MLDEPIQTLVASSRASRSPFLGAVSKMMFLIMTLLAFLIRIPPPVIFAVEPTPITAKKDQTVSIACSNFVSTPYSNLQVFETLMSTIPQPLRVPEILMLPPTLAAAVNAEQLVTVVAAALPPPEHFYEHSTT